MPNTEIVRALVSAFNVNNYNFNAIKTNFTLQSRGGEDCIVVSFDEGMNRYQCQEYLDSIKRKIVGEFYDAKEGRYEVVLNTGKSIFDVKSFPFNDYKGCWSVGKQGGIEFLVPIDKGVIFNLKSHLAASLAKDVREDMPTSTVFVEAPDKKGCLWLGKFPDKELCKEFEREFLSRIRERYENVPKNPLEVKGNSVYIKDVFDDARFIDSVTRRAVWLVGRDLQADSKSRSDVRAFKDLIIEFINQSIGLTVAGFVCDFPLGKEEATVFTPVVLDNRESRVLASKEALKLNYAFNGAVFYDLYGRTQGELSINGSSGIYSIDFSNPEISHCVITKIIESSVINAKHELSIDPELPRTLLTEASPESPTRSQGEVEKSPRQGSGKKEEIGEPFQLLPGREIGQASASSQQTNRLSSPPSAEFSSYSSSGSALPSASKVMLEKRPASLCSTDSGKGNSLERSKSSSFVNGPSSLEGANESRSALPSASLCSIDSGKGNSLERSKSSSFVNGPSSSRGANESTRTGNSTFYVSSSGVEDVNVVEPEKQQVSDECSEAKSQESKSPEKQHGGGLFCKEGPILAKLSPLKRNNEERSSIYSSKSDLMHPVTEKPPLSKRSSSLPLATVKSIQFSKVTLPVITEPPSQGAVDKLNIPGDRNSQVSADSGVGPSQPGSQPPSLTKKSSNSSQWKECVLKQFLNKLFSDNGKTIKDLLFDKKTFSRFDREMQKVLSLPLSCDMISNLLIPLPFEKHVEEYEKLILLARSGKVKLSQSPEEIEQLYSSLSHEGQEICSLLFFPKKQNEMPEGLLPTAKEQVDLFWEIFTERGFNSTSSEESGIFSGSSSQGSTSDEDKLKDSGRWSVSSNSSTSTVSTKVDSPKTEKHSQEEREVFV